MVLPNGVKTFEDMSNCLDTVTQNDRQSDEQTCHNNIALYMLAPADAR